MTNKNTAVADTPRLQTLSRKNFWQHHVSQWRDSGMSKRAYDQKYALVYHQMLYWCARATKDHDDTRSRTSDFVPVTVVPTVTDAGLRVRLPSGISIVGIDEHSVNTS